MLLTIKSDKKCKCNKLKCNLEYKNSKIKMFRIKNVYRVISLLYRVCNKERGKLNALNKKYEIFK